MPLESEGKEGVMGREILGGFHGPDPEAAPSLPSLFCWPELGFVVPSNCKTGWECSLALCQEGQGNGLGGYREGSDRGPLGDV